MKGFGLPWHLWSWREPKDSRARRAHRQFSLRFTILDRDFRADNASTSQQDNIVSYYTTTTHMPIQGVSHNSGPNEYFLSF